VPNDASHGRPKSETRQIPASPAFFESKLRAELRVSLNSVRLESREGI
jgi:hypothetical protein